MKGTKDGLVLHLDDQCAYGEIILELKQKIEEGGIDGTIDVQLYLGNRYCTEVQKNELVDLVQSQGNMLVSNVLSDVLTVEECNRTIEQQTCYTYVGIVRSGQTIRATGDIIIIGDVNPNGKIEANGNIYVLGKLKGNAQVTEGNAEVTEGNAEETRNNRNPYAYHSGEEIGFAEETWNNRIPYAHPNWEQYGFAEEKARKKNPYAKNNC